MAKTAPHESPEVRTRAVLAVVGVIFALLVAIAFGFQLLFPDRIGQTYTVRTGFPVPAVVANEGAERLALEARQRRELSGAGGRIKIESAMVAIATKGKHAYDPIGTAP